MIGDPERLERIQQAIREAGWDALICALPTNVLMLSGYYPVVGTSLAVATREGRIGLIAPEDERELAERGRADELFTFQAGSLEEIKTATRAIRSPLARLAGNLKISGIIGCEQGAFHEPSSYAGMHFYGGALREILSEAIPNASLAAADDWLMRLRSVKSSQELARLRAACRIAQSAFEHGAQNLRVGLSEAEAAIRFRGPLSAQGVGFEGMVERADGFVYCMSGPNAAQAYAAYQRSRARVLLPGDFALVHCNSHADGFWTDITRTFVLGGPDERQRKMYEAALAAREAALQAIQPGARAADVDRAAREVLSERGFGPAFKHPTGHGVGFAAINHTAQPRIHPASLERLETGMVFNVEPGIYLEGYGGLRHCDLVAVTGDGAEILTPFQTGLEALSIA